MLDDRRPNFARYFPKEGGASLVLTSAIAGAAGILTSALGIYVFKDYGIALFCATPLAMGVAAPLLHGMGARRNFLELFGAAVLAQFFLFIGMIVFAIEGIFCIIMAAPLWLTLATIGALLAYPIHRAIWKNYATPGARGFPVIGLLALCMVPMWMGAEHIAAPESPLFVVSTTLDIDAPPDVVWNRTVSFPDMPAPGYDHGGWLFHAGIATPIRAEITGTGLAATRYCVFSTGRAVEPITTWDPGHLLEVDVISTPPSMEETSIYPHLHPAHLEGYLVSAKARFELIELPNHRTRIAGTSWYTNKMFPSAYWQLWSDAAIKAVQVHVLEHIKTLSEHDMQLHGGTTHVPH